MQRFIPNSNQGLIIDAEIITIYLFRIAFQEKHKVKSLDKYILDHWSSWFAILPSYEMFVARLNRIVDVFPMLVACLIEDPDTLDMEFPIVLAD